MLAPMFALLAALGLASADAQPAASPQQQLQQQRGKDPCGQRVRVEQRSFQQLPSTARYAYVWIDDIRSKFWGGHFPFDVFVVVGSVYSPFQANNGRLDRASFDRLMTAASTTNKRFGPLKATEDAIKLGTAQLSFNAGNQKFSLKVTEVDTSLGGEDAAIVQLCIP